MQYVWWNHWNFLYSNGALQIDTLATPLLNNDMRLAIDIREIERDLEIARKKTRSNPWVNVTDFSATEYAALAYLTILATESRKRMQI